MAVLQDLGKVSVIAKGEWDSGVAYEPLDIVSSNGGAYLSKKAVPAGTALSDTTYWQQITSRGEQGIQGEQGEQGETGNGIASIAKTSTSGNVDTYTITMTDGSTSTFTVTNTNILGETSATKTAIGSDAAPNSTGNSVVAVGRTALYALTTGAQNVAVGAGAANSLTTGQSNTVIGASANTAAATTNYGTAVGRTAVTGADSVAIGANAKANGAYGTAVGYGTEVTASRGTAIGAGTKANFAGSVAIGQDSSGNSATASANNEMVIGTAAHKVKIPGTQYDGTFKASTPNPTYGEELAPALSSWTGTDATYSDGKWTVATGGTISTAIECEAEADYLIKLTERIDGVLVSVENAVTPNEALKPCTISLGDASMSIFGANDANWYVVLRPTTGGSLTLTIGGGEWSGRIPYVSVKKITAYANAALNVQDRYIAMPSTSVVVGNGFAKQGITEANNVAVGYHSQENAQSGKGNVGVGLYTQQNIKNGSHNVAVGESAQRYLETGMYNFAVGYSAQSKLKSGCWNVAMGNEAQRDLTTGCNNVSLGRRAHNDMTTGNKNVAIGAQAGFVRAEDPSNPDVTTAAYATKTGAEQVLVGFQATQTQNEQGAADGAIAIGARAMANTDGIAIGRDTKASAPGSIAIGRDSQGNSAEANNTDEIVIGTENHTIKLGGKPVDEFAVITGSYDGMTVGSAQQLLASSGIEDKAPYAYRTSGGSMDIGDREELNEINGMTVAWNQLVQNGDFTSTSNWSINNGTQDVSNNELTVTINSDRTYAMSAYALNGLNGHKVLAMCDAKVGTATQAQLQLYNATSTPYSSNVITTTSSLYVRLAGICVAGDNLKIRLRLEGEGGQTAIFRNATAYDLTAMFGATIADYVYSLEQAQAGAGVAWFRNLFPNSFYAYSAPTLMSVKTTGHKTVGFNQWDEQWELGAIVNGNNVNSSSSIRGKNYHKCIPNTIYYKKTPKTTFVNWYDANKEFISRSSGDTNVTVSSPENAHYFRLSMATSYGTTYNNDICINLSWSGTRNGEYEPYVEHTYPLDSTLELRGIPKLDSNNKLYADGDIYAPNGTVTRRFTQRAYQSGDEELANAITDGTNTVVELATPTTEQADPYQQTQVVNDWGTEEFIDSRDIAIPVGHKTTYLPNLRDKLQHLPSLASDDGYYLISQQNNTMSLELFRIPKAPSEDGTYQLKATVTSGTPTYFWEAIV